MAQIKKQNQESLLELNNGTWDACDKAEFRAYANFYNPAWASE